MTNEEFVTTYSTVAFAFDELVKNLEIAEDERQSADPAREFIDFIENNSDKILMEPLKNNVRLYLGKEDFDTIPEPNRLTLAIFNLADINSTKLLSLLLLCTLDKL